MKLLVILAASVVALAATVRGEDWYGRGATRPTTQAAPVPAGGELAQLRERVAQLERENAALRERIGAATSQPAEDRIAQAIEAHRPIPGMNMAQLKQIDPNPELQQETEKSRSYEVLGKYDFNDGTPFYGVIYDIQSDRITRVWLTPRRRLEMNGGKR